MLKRCAGFDLLLFLVAEVLCAGQKPLMRFVQLSDGHAVLPQDAGRIKDFGGRMFSRSRDILRGGVKFIQTTLRPDFVIYTGDFVENGGWKSGVEAMRFVKATIEDAGLKLFTVMGNHEVAEDKYEAVFGLADYRFYRGDFHFVVLKSTRYYPILRLHRTAFPRHLLYQLDDFLTMCRANTFILVHEPLVCQEETGGWGRPENYQTAVKILERHPFVVAVLQGHTHNFFRKLLSGIEYIICPGLVDAGDRGDPSLNHCMLLYEAYTDRVEVQMYGAKSTDDAYKGIYLPSEKIRFSFRLKKRAQTRGKPEDLRKLSLPNSPDRFDPLIEEGTKFAALYLFEGWKFKTDPENKGLKEGWHRLDWDDSQWKPNTHIQNRWENYLAPNYDGYAWYRTRFSIPASPKGERLSLWLGRIDDSDQTYFNGTLIGKTGALPPQPVDPGSKKVYRNYPLRPDSIHYGQENVIAIRVYDAGDDGGTVYGKPFIRFER